MAPKAQKPPAFQFYPKDWDTDENVIPMTYEEEGVYWALCRRYWLAGNTLPADLDTLRGLLKGRPTLKKMQGWWQIIGRCFVATDGRLSHKKLDALRDEQQANKKTRQEAANVRWERERGAKQTDAMHLQSTTSADALQCSASASASSSAVSKHAQPKPVQGVGAFEPGSLPRDFKNYAMLSRGNRVRLSYQVFDKFIARYGGTKDEARAALQGFVDKLEVEHQSIGDYLWLDGQFTAFLRQSGRLKDAQRVDDEVRDRRLETIGSAHDQKIRDIRAGRFNG